MSVVCFCVCCNNDMPVMPLPKLSSSAKLLASCLASLLLSHRDQLLPVDRPDSHQVRYISSDQRLRWSCIFIRRIGLQVMTCIGYNKQSFTVMEARPTYEFYIPSIYDDTALACRIYTLPELYFGGVPANQTFGSTPWTPRGAVSRHPEV